MKSAAYIQSWHQKKTSKITFGIAPAQSLDPKNASYHGKPRRHADVYVFCLLAHEDKSTADPLDVDQWKFYLVPTSALDRTVGKQKTVTLSSLRRLKPTEARWSDLSKEVEAFAK